MANDSLVGKMVADRFCVLQRLGEGTTGDVYLAENDVLSRQFAIKVLKREMQELPSMAGRFRREARAAGRLDHPNIVSVSDFGQMQDGRLFMVLEYVPGRSLARELEALVPDWMNLRRALNLLKQIASALSAAHDAGIIHRDVKPDNILLTTTRGGEEQVKMLDFGLAKLMVDADMAVLTQQGEVFGTPNYIAPEQAMGRTVDSRADIYAFGIIAYELLTGHVPFRYENITQLLIAHQSEIPEPISTARPASLPRVPDRVLRFAMQCLEKNRDARPLRLSEFHRIVDASIAELPEEGTRLTSSLRRAVGSQPTVWAEEPAEGDWDELTMPDLSDGPVNVEAARAKELRWLQLGMKARELARTLQRQGIGVETLRPQVAAISDNEDRLIDLESDVARHNARIDELDVEYRDHESELRRAILELSNERGERSGTAPEPEAAADLTRRIAQLEKQLAEVYSQKDRQQREIEQEIAATKKQVAELGARRPKLVRQLVALLQRARPQSLPPELQAAYAALDQLHHDL